MTITRQIFVFLALYFWRRRGELEIPKEGDLS
jgi:hypothetical protein